MREAKTYLGLIAEFWNLPAVVTSYAGVEQVNTGEKFVIIYIWPKIADHPKIFVYILPALKSIYLFIWQDLT